MMLFLTSAQRSAEVSITMRAIFLSLGVCVSAVCGQWFTDLRQVAFSCKQKFQFI